MGLSIVMAGAIIMITLVIVLYSFSGFALNIFSLSEVSSEVSEHDDSISKSEISLNHVSTLVGSPDIDLTLRNDGQVKTWRFPMYDVLVTYDGATSGRLTEQLSYDGDCLGGTPPAGSWCIESISRDMLDPGLLNPTEEADIRLRVNENLADVNAIISFATAKGVTSKVMAPYCGPSCYQMLWTVVSDETVINWANIGPGIEPINNLDNFRSIIDLSDMTEWRIVVHVDNGVGTAACEIGVQHSTDGGATWSGLDNGVAGSLSTSTISCDSAGDLVSGWSEINVDAQTDVWLRVAGTDTGTPDPTLGTVQVQFRS